MNINKNTFTTLEQLEIEFVPEKTKNQFLDKITNNLYLGERAGALQFDFFKSEGITNVISLIGNFSPKSNEYNELNGIKRKIIDIADFFTENIIQYFIQCIEFIEKGSKTYVHCMMGVSRSASIVIAYLMWKTKSSYENVYNFVKKKRKWISPNEGFQKQLKIFEQMMIRNDYDLNKIDVKSVKWDRNSMNY